MPTPQRPRPARRTTPATPRAAVSLIVTAAAITTSNPADAAIYHDDQPRQPLIDWGSKFVAANGGPAVTMVISSTDYPATANNGLFVAGELVVSGTLGPRGADGRLSVLGGAHSLFVGTTPQHITGIRIYTGTNWQTDPGQMLQVDMSTLRLAPGANGTLNSLDLFGAKLVGNIPGLGSFTVSGAAEGSTVVQVGNGFYRTSSELQAGTKPHRDFQTMAWNAVVMNRPPGDVSATYMNNSAWGDFLPKQGLNAVLDQGDSNGPIVAYDSVQWSSDGRVSSFTLVGVGVGYNYLSNTYGSNIFVDFRNPVARDFVNSFTVPEPAALGLAAAAVATATLGRRRRLAATAVAALAVLGAGMSAQAAVYQDGLQRQPYVDCILTTTGLNYWVDFGNPVARDFVNSFIVPEPGAFGLIGTALTSRVLRRRRPA